jgi:hypothetical protein
MLFTTALALFFSSGLVSVIPTYSSTADLPRGCGTIPNKQFIAAAEAGSSANKVATNLALQLGHFYLASIL